MERKFQVNYIGLKAAFGHSARFRWAIFFFDLRGFQQYLLIILNFKTFHSNFRNTFLAFMLPNTFLRIRHFCTIKDWIESYVVVFQPTFISRYLYCLWFWKINIDFSIRRNSNSMLLGTYYVIMLETIILFHFFSEFGTTTRSRVSLRCFIWTCRGPFCPGQSEDCCF